jgi:glycosyltransferase involved in cell wall biosynthesis
MLNAQPVVKEEGNISLCMIVKNEELYLRDCLESVKDIINQIILVDTGSTDATIDIAREYKADIYHFKWCDDFAAARQESIKHAKCDWIFWLDADERLRPASIPEIKKLTCREEKAVLYNVLIYNKINKGTDVQISCSPRLFNNFKGIYFIGKIHEQLAPSLKAVHGVERESNIIIDHLGYDLEDKQRYRRIKMNRFLLLKMVKQHPRNADAHYSLAQHYALTLQPEAALKHYKIALQLNQFNMAMTASLLNKMAELLLKLGKIIAAKEHCLESIKLIALQLGGYNLLYTLAFNEGHFQEALNWLKILQINNQKIRLKSAKKIPTDILIDEDTILFNLASLYYKLNKFDKAVEYFENIYNKNKDNTAVQRQLLSLYTKLGFLDKAKEMEMRLAENKTVNEDKQSDGNI